MPNSANNFESHTKAAKVLLAVVIVAAVSGFFMGLRQTATTAESRGLAQMVTHPQEGQEPEAPEARSYLAMATLPKANDAWINELGKLAQPPTDLFASNIIAALPSESVEQRLVRRAYDGAPPVIPHPVEQVSAASCLACHGEGKIIKDRVAARISHAHYSNCTQCHVPSVGAGPPLQDLALEPLAGNSFSGLSTFGKGARAYEGAPPTIPHPTAMRGDCMSCHGPQGAAALRTSHPWRQSCTQCHLPSAELDQRGLLADERARMESLLSAHFGKPKTENSTRETTQ